MRSSRLAVFFALMFPLWVNAQEPGDSRAGLTFARANCAECHAIKDTEVKSPNPNAPTFASVAKTPGMTGRALAVWLQTSHPTMPNFLVAEKDRDNVIAYIMSLQPTPAQ
jgi:mono/diheme cytochrome c family protein